MNPTSDVIVLIPSLHPDSKLVAYVQDLIYSGFKDILVVDDGSGPAYSIIFDQIRNIPQCTVLSYEVNKGKGHALKVGMEWVLTNKPQAKGVVTADSDGQHTTEDCIKVAESILSNPEKLVLGSRDFGGKDVPPKSRIGNRLTSFFFALLYGKWLPDTQTGLRAFGIGLVPRLIQVSGDRFEYEMNVLIQLRLWRVDFEVVTIHTVYHNANAGTHFRPLHDSLRIYKLLFGNFFRFASSSVISMLLDNGIFNILDIWILPLLFNFPHGNQLFNRVLLATAIARAVSSLFNYYTNLKYVFKAEHSKSSLGRYYLLVIVMILLSSFLVNFVNESVGLPRSIVKIIVDTVLFFINFRVMRYWVFGSDKRKQ